MTIDLPKALSDYLDAKRAYDNDALLATLTPDAVVTDEGHVYTSHPAIREWNSRASKAIRATYELKSSTRIGETYDLAVEIAGNFPTSPVILHFYATLRGKRIAAMTIVGEALPPPVAAYIQATNTFDVQAARKAFIDDALVNDIKREFRGASEIARWFEDESAGDRVTMSPIEISSAHGNTVVRAAVDGNYDKTGLPDPLVLTYYFSSVSGRISQLIIVANKAA